MFLSDRRNFSFFYNGLVDVLSFAAFLYFYFVDSLLQIEAKNELEKRLALGPSFVHCVRSKDKWHDEVGNIEYLNIFFNGV
jgi:hypothetical protein